jgi:outer membrane lipoprotein SlyB
MTTQAQYEDALTPTAPLYDSEEEVEIRKELRKSVPPPGHPETGAGAIVGAIAGAIVGAFAGPAGVAAGTALGAVAGAAAGRAMGAAEEAQAAHERALDDAIGVTQGDLGAARVRRDSSHGLFSGSSTGVSAGMGRSPASGPMGRG